jgi:DNA-binding transcriptional LysR family regulator
MVELAVTEANVADLVTRLDEGAFDAVILNLQDMNSDRFDRHDLYSERYVVVFPTDHRLASFDTIALKDLAREPYVDRLACEMRELVMDVCAQHSIELYARFRSDREDWVQAMVLAGIGFAFAPEYSVTLPGLLQRPLVEPTVVRSVSLATPRGRPFSPAVAAFIRTVKAYRWPG